MKKAVSALLAVCMLVIPAWAGGMNARGAMVLPDVQDALKSAVSQAALERDADSTPPPIPTEGDVWDGSIEQPTALVQKDGVNYYEITKCSQLAYVAETGGEWLSRNYILGNNLILNDVEITWDDDGNCTNGDALRQWTPIGKDYDDHPFTGIFDGGNYTISGLYVAKEGSYCGLFGFAANNANISNVKAVNSYVNGLDHVGGITGMWSPDSVVSAISQCVFSGVVKGRDQAWDRACGGICGESNGKIVDCANYGAVFGGSTVGGIVGATNYGSLINCINYGNVTGQKNVGGIVGVADDVNNGCYASCNMGNIRGKENVGGIGGAFSSTPYGSSSLSCRAFYNTGTVEGDNYVGGIVGFSDGCKISQAYNIGAVTGTANVGGIIGSDGAVWDKDTISNTYFLQTETVNTGLNGCGSTVAMEGMKACTASEMLRQSAYQGFDFTEIWRMDSNQNGGYPYFSWQTVGEITVSGVTLNKAALSMGVGDSEYLAAAVTPANAPSTGFTWASSDEQIATVSQGGKVTAVSPGTARITVTTQEGGCSASCDVTVTPRTQGEYKINSITLRSQSGDVLSRLPYESFWASVSVTNQASAGDAMVLLASYDAGGKYLGMMCAQAKDIPVGASFEFSFLMDNSNGRISKIKAFLVSSLDNLKPIGEAVSWQPSK